MNSGVFTEKTQKNIQKHSWISGRFNGEVPVGRNARISVGIPGEIPGDIASKISGGFPEQSLDEFLEKFLKKFMKKYLNAFLKESHGELLQKSLEENFLFFLNTLK